MKPRTCHTLFCHHMQWTNEHRRTILGPPLWEEPHSNVPTATSHLDGGMRWAWSPWGASSVWMPSTVREQLSQQDAAAAAAGSKQAETVDSVNHSFTPSKLRRTRQRAGESLSQYAFFFIRSPLTLKIVSAPLVSWTEPTHPVTRGTHQRGKKRGRRSEAPCVIELQVTAANMDGWALDTDTVLCFHCGWTLWCSVGEFVCLGVNEGTGRVF